MITISNRLAVLIPFQLQRIIGARISLKDMPAIRIKANSRAAKSLSNWSPGWLVDALRPSYNKRKGWFIDVGANVGQSLLSAYNVGYRRYLGFEPNPAAAGALDEIIALNQLRECVVMACALSDSSRLSKLYVSYLTDTGATMMTNLRDISKRRTQIVPTYPLDYILEDIGISEISAIKIDAEAHELEVILGMREILRSIRPPIICEVLGTAQGRPLSIKNERNAKLYATLKENEYRLFNIVKEADDGSIQSLVEHDHFPDIYWDRTNSDSFDYIFIPRELNWYDYLIV